METPLQIALTSTYKDELIAFFNKHPEYFEEAVLLALSNKSSYCWRAAWLISNCMKPNDKRILKHLDSFLNSIQTKKDSEQREYLKIFQKIEFDENKEGILFTICVSIWQDVSKKPATRFNAIKIILHIAQKYPELMSEIKHLTENRYLESLTPGVKHSLSILIKNAGKEKQC